MHTVPQGSGHHGPMASGCKPSQVQLGDLAGLLTLRVSKISTLCPYCLQEKRNEQVTSVLGVVIDPSSLSPISLTSCSPGYQVLRRAPEEEEEPLSPGLQCHCASPFSARPRQCPNLPPPAKRAKGTGGQTAQEEYR